MSQVLPSKLKRMHLTAQSLTVSSLITLHCFENSLCTVRVIHP
jgi:hypothetical protein